MNASFLLSLRTAVAAVGLAMGMAAGAAPGPADSVVVTASLRADLAYTPSSPSGQHGVMAAGVPKASNLAGGACVSGECDATAEMDASASNGIERQTYALLGACLLAVIFMSRRRRTD
jgi:hypothetical protein